ncbi:hypothetical protein IAD21_00841 [Abditibacteriota bacterium]|nr:hypothetical protein IAD21_00841 [Abditibacteriota bacterium]
MPHSFKPPAASGRGRTLGATQLAATLALFLLSIPALAQNPEDDPIPDEDTPTQPVAPPPPVKPAPTPPAKTPPVAPGKTVPDQPAANVKPPGQTPPPVTPPTTPNTAPTTPVAPPPTTTGNPDVTLTRGQLDQLLRQQAELQRQIDELKQANATRTDEGGAGDTGVGNTGSANDGTTGNGTASQGSGSGTPTSAAPATGSNRALLLPDISFIGQGVGLYSTDRRDDARSQFRLSEGEIGIQGYVYPGVKADAFITGAPAEDEPFQLEEGYLSFLGVRPGLNIYAGRKFVPFGRTGEQHNHSWLYSRQLIPFRDLISEEALTGDGVNFRYTRPFGKIYTQADFGIFAGEGNGTLSTDATGAFDPANPFGSDLPRGSGVSFTRRFYNSRLYAAVPVGTNGEFALGASYARGRSAFGDSDGVELGNGNAAIFGFDGTYRRYLSGGRRILARAEYFGYRPGQGLPTSSAGGYYGLLNYRFNPTYDIGFLAERSGFPQAPGQHENALSLIFTKQFTEQFYGRLQATHGDRPGKGAFNEIFFQFVFGLGPHTHSLE